MNRTFSYIGNANALLVGSNRLVKGEPFETDDGALADYLATFSDIEEVKTAKKPEDAPQADQKGKKRHSLKDDAERS